MLRANVTKECGSMGKRAVKEFICILMGQDMWAISLQTHSMVAVDRNGLMAPFMKANSTMAKNMDRAFLAGPTATHTKARLTIIR